MSTKTINRAKDSTEQYKGNMSNHTVKIIVIWTVKYCKNLSIG